MAVEIARPPRRHAVTPALAVLPALPAEPTGPEPAGPVIGRYDVTTRTVQEVRAERREARRRADIGWQVALVTLVWLVTVPFLMAWDYTGRQVGSSGHTLASVLTVLLPFSCAVIATRNRLWLLGGVYVIVTLAMVLPAVAIARAGG